MMSFAWKSVRRVALALAPAGGALSGPTAQADPYHYHGGRGGFGGHNHYHGGSFGYGPGFSFSVGSGGTYYGASSSFYGPGLSVYSGPSYGGPVIYPPLYIDQYGNPEGVGYGGYGYGVPYGYGYGVPYGYGVTSPYVYPQLGNTIERAPAPSGSFSPAMTDPGQAGRTIGRDPLNVRPNVQTHPQLVKPSTPDAQLRALRLQDMGDQQMRALRYSNAAQAYEKAIEAAPDIPDPYFRLAIAFIGKGRLVEAANTFEEAAALDPGLPWRAAKLDDVLGVENRLGKEQLKESVVQWANNDVRDAKRLFLLGVMMHLDNDPRSREILEAASKFGGGTPGLTAFLNPPANVPAATTPAPIPAAPNNNGGLLGPRNLSDPVMPRGNVPVPPQPQLNGIAPGNGTPLPPAPMPSTVPQVPALPTPAAPGNPGGSTIPVPTPAEPQPTPANGSGVELPIPVAPSPVPSAGTPPLLVPPR